MPHTSSAAKRLRQNEKRRLRNRTVKSSVKTQVKKVMALAEKGSAEDLRKEVQVAVRKLDKAAAKGVIHRNLAARKKSQLARLVHRKEHPPAAPAAT